jgi:hypothetical protein
MAICREKRFGSIAFPLIGTGSGGFPQERAQAVMMETLPSCGDVKEVVFVWYQKCRQNSEAQRTREQPMASVDPYLSRAVVLFLGFGSSSFPKRDSDRLVKDFGSTEGTAMDTRVRALIDESDRIEFDWSKHSLGSAADEAGRILHERHPELSDEAIGALGWRFGFVNR